jgi:autotransporter-associated beta strand protein
MWTNPNGTTPSIVQVDFGPWGENMPGYGEMYCCPTSLVMQLYYLGANGFTQLAPATYDGESNPKGAAANLDRVIAGLIGTTATGGTGFGMNAGVAAYLSACGIAPDQYMTATSPNPDLASLAAALEPNIAQSPEFISMTVFWVAWYSGTPPNQLSQAGGHTLAPLMIDPSDSTKLILNNAFPSSFEKVPNEPGENPQTVAITPVPASWELGLTYPAQDYSQVVSGNEGSNGAYAILTGMQYWWISPEALPSSASYAPSPWQIASPHTLDTNGGALTVIAPLVGAGGLVKTGLGLVVLTAANGLTGANVVGRGALSSTVKSGAPFGTGAISLTGGGSLAVASGGALSIASGPGAVFEIGEGAALVINGAAAATVTIGNDASASSLQRLARGTLLIAPGAGLQALGGAQQVTIASGAPPIANGAVAPFILGKDTDASGGFLAYGDDGFTPAATLSSANTGINSAPTDALYQVVDAQIISAGGTVKLAALEVDEGGSIGGGAGTNLLVGDQSAGSVGGVILNGGSIDSGTLAFGAAESAIYVSGAGGTISSAITGGDLTSFGPGALTLTGAGSLSGSVVVNAGKLVMASSVASAAGDAPIFVNADASLEAAGLIAGRVNLGNAATLLLSDGALTGGLSSMADLAPPAPPALLRGSGVVGGQVTYGGAIQSGPAAGLITFANDVTIAGSASFTWTPQSLVDNSNSAPGLGWNGLVFQTTQSDVGTKEEHVTFYLDFTRVGSDPDGGDRFWKNSHQWTLFNFAANDGSCYWSYGNFDYVRGSFSLNWDGWDVCLFWTPASTPQSWAERQRSAAAARAAPPPGRPGG